MTNIKDNKADFYKPLIIGGTNRQIYNQSNIPTCFWKPKEEVIHTWQRVQEGREREDPLYAGLGKGTLIDRYTNEKGVYK